MRPRPMLLAVALALITAGCGGGAKTPKAADSPLPAECVQPPYSMVVHGGELGSDTFQVVSVAAFSSDAFTPGAPAYAVYFADHEMTAAELPDSELLGAPALTGSGIRAHVNVATPDGAPLKPGQSIAAVNTPEGLMPVAAGVFTEGRGLVENAYNTQEGSVTILALTKDQICLDVDYSTVLSGKPNLVIRGTVLARVREL